MNTRKHPTTYTPALRRFLQVEYDFDSASFRVLAALALGFGLILASHAGSWSGNPIRCNGTWSSIFQFAFCLVGASIFIETLNWLQWRLRHERQMRFFHAHQAFVGAPIRGPVHTASDDLSLLRPSETLDAGLEPTPVPQTDYRLALVGTRLVFVPRKLGPGLIFSAAIFIMALPFSDSLGGCSTLHWNNLAGLLILVYSFMAFGQVLHTNVYGPRYRVKTN